MTKTRLKKFGILKATKKASEVMVDPRNLAIKISRINPKTRLKKVKKLTVKNGLKNPCILQFYIVMSDLYKYILGLNYAKNFK